MADLEAGIGTLTRLPEQAVEQTLVIVEPTPRSMDVGMRAVRVATEQEQGEITIVANKIANGDDDARVRSTFSEFNVVTIPADPVVTDADRKGMSPIDLDPEAPAIAAIAELGRRLFS